jgi:maleate isomerase
MKLDFQTDAGVGSRATLGVILLEEDETLEGEFARVLRRDGVALYHSRIPMEPHVRPDTLARMEAALPATARLLPSAPDYAAIAFACTSAASVIGSANVAKAIRSVCPGAKVTDPLDAIIAAGRALGARRLGFVTPYLPEVSALMRIRLEEAGFEIAGFGSFEESDDRVVARITEDAILSAVSLVANAAPCDAVVVSCTSLRCLNVIPQAERLAGVPVLSSNQALAWRLLQLAGVEEPRPEFGRLFA